MQKLCECGCGDPAPIATTTHRQKGRTKGEPMRFICGHNMRTPAARRRAAEQQLGKTGPDSPAWKGGKVSNGGGYTLVNIDLLDEDDRKLAEPMRTNNLYVFEHRLVVARRIGRSLTSKEVVHHRNGIKDDNRDENLELLPCRGGHMKTHAKERRTIQRLRRENSELRAEIARLQSIVQDREGR